MSHASLLKGLLVAAGATAVSALAYNAHSRAPKTDRVTISLYSVENRDSKDESYDKRALNEVANIKLIKEKLTAAARAAGRRPPEIVVSVVLIPDWKKGSSYEDDQYNQTRKEFLGALTEKNGDEDIQVEDFYAKPSLTEAERGYLQGLQAKGSVADMIKTHAIVCPENDNRRHLQLDSNTKIPDFAALYNQTIGAQAQSDGLNASYYDINYVSAHNKIVYTPGIIYTAPDGNIAPELRAVHLQYCATHKDDHLIDDEEVKAEKLSKNSIYAKDFAVALSHIGLTTEKVLRPPSKPERTIYPANLGNAEAYRLTAHVLTAVNMSWSTEIESKVFAPLKALPPIKVGDTDCDYACFANAVKKHTGTLSAQGDDPNDEEKAHQALLAISDCGRETRMIQDFITHVFDHHPAQAVALIQTIPDTDRGLRLVEKLFQGKFASVDDLRAEAERVAAHPVLQTSLLSSTGPPSS